MSSGPKFFSQRGISAGFYKHHMAQEEMILRRGSAVIHETAIKCTCRKGDITDVSFKIELCERCRGEGVLYRNPTQQIGLVTNIRQSYMQSSQYQTMPGDCMIGFSKDINPPIQEFDRITFTWASTVTDGNTFIRGAEAKINPNLLPNEDRIYYKAANVIWCEDENGAIYRQGVDFVIEGYKIRWLIVPEANLRISLKYTAYLEWICFNNPFERHDNIDDIGPRIMLRKRHVVSPKYTLEGNPPDRTLFSLL